MTPEQIKAVLSPYYGALTQTAIDHITEQIAALLPEVQETVEWGVRVASNDPDYVFPLPTKPFRVRDGKREVAERMVARSPETRTAVTRTRRRYADEVSEWTEVTE